MVAAEVRDRKEDLRRVRESPTPTPVAYVGSPLDDGRPLILVQLGEGEGLGVREGQIHGRKVTAALE